MEPRVRDRCAYGSPFHLVLCKRTLLTLELLDDQSPPLPTIGYRQLPLFKKTLKDDVDGFFLPERPEAMPLLRLRIGNTVIRTSYKRFGVCYGDRGLLPTFSAVSLKDDEKPSSSCFMTATLVSDERGFFLALKIMRHACTLLAPFHEKNELHLGRQGCRLVFPLSSCFIFAEFTGHTHQRVAVYKRPTPDVPYERTLVLKYLGPLEESITRSSSLPRSITDATILGLNYTLLVDHDKNSSNRTPRDESPYYHLKSPFDDNSRTCSYGFHEFTLRPDDGSIILPDLDLVC